MYINTNMYIQYIYTCIIQQALQNAHPCIYIYKYAHMHIHICIPIHKYVHLHIYTCKYTCVYISIYKCGQRLISIYKYICVNIQYLYIYICVCVCTHTEITISLRAAPHGVAMISRLLKIIGLFCKRAL